MTDIRSLIGWAGFMLVLLLAFTVDDLIQESPDPVKCRVTARAQAAHLYNFSPEVVRATCTGGRGPITRCSVAVGKNEATIPWACTENESGQISCNEAVGVEQ